VKTLVEKQTFRDKFFNWLYSIPFVRERWAQKFAQGTSKKVDLSGEIPFASLSKPLEQCRVALLTTGGFHLEKDPPFDMEDSEGDASYRVIPAAATSDEVTITHKYYNHRDADADRNVVFPLDHFHDLAQAGVIGEVAPRHYSFMGHIEGPHLERLVEETAPEVASQLQKDGVDVAFLTPA
jgi:D-proline reductase (dithiol) PrdB